jgi:hypothetical protein
VNGVKDVSLLDVTTDEPQALATTTPVSALDVFERLASSGGSVEAIERLMALWERLEAKKAEQAFNAAMTEAQKEMRAVAPDAFNPQTKSKYATLAALDADLRPVYTKHGFALSFDTGDAPHEQEVRVLCYVSHGGGHSKTYKIDMPADGKGAKGGDVMTRTHATGSAASYGQRYLLKLIFNVTVGDLDDDGNGAAKTRPPSSDPAGFDVFLDVLASAAMNGTKALMAEFNKGSEAIRRHLTATHPTKWAAYKTTASEADKRPAVRGGAK